MSLVLSPLVSFRFGSVRFLDARTQTSTRLLFYPPLLFTKPHSPQKRLDFELGEAQVAHELFHLMIGGRRDALGLAVEVDAAELFAGALRLELIADAIDAQALATLSVRGR